MDLTALRTALRIYVPTYRAHATQLASPSIGRQWMESMDWQSATPEELKAHAKEAAEWANLGLTPEDAAPHIAAGITPAMYREMEDYAEQAAGGPDALVAQRIQQMVETGEIVGPDRIIRVQDPTEPTREIITIRDEH